MPTPVHIVAGFLGTGKTTVLQRELAARAGRERCAVVVNDFGDARIDATLLGGDVRVSDIAGGCMCCTAPDGLVPALSAILDELRPDRVFIEPSGLARPRDVVDMLGRGGLGDRITRMPTVVLVDPGRVAPRGELDEEQLDGADFVVLSRVDVAPPARVEAVRAEILARWPGPLGVVEAQDGRVPTEVWAWPAGAGPRADGVGHAHDPAFGEDPASAHGHDHDHGHHGGGDGDRPPSTVGFRARSWVFTPHDVFAWDRLKAIVAGAPGIARFKGLFHTELGWFRLDVAGGRVHVGLSPWRRDSRADLVVDAAGDPDAFDAALRSAVLPPEVTTPGDVLALVDADGVEVSLSRGALRAMPGQVPDVGAVVSGRVGEGVWMREVLTLAGRGARYVVSARDGFTSPPVDVAGVGDAVLVHGVAGAPLPDELGGPFRLLVPKSGSNCANVKAVSRVRVLRG